MKIAVLVTAARLAQVIHVFAEHRHAFSIRYAPHGQTRVRRPSLGGQNPNWLFWMLERLTAIS
jgi:hypothetical protein